MIAAVKRRADGKIDIWSHPLFSDLSDSEKIRALADAFRYPSIADHKVCAIPGCDIAIHRGNMCTPHERIWHAEYERQRYIKKQL